VGQAKWSDIDVLNQVRGLVPPWIEQHGPIAAWVIDDSGLPKQGKHRAWLRTPGKSSRGVKLWTKNSHRALPACGSGRLTGITS
jgi:hypothetical protein